MERDYKLFGDLLRKIEDGMTITFTPENVDACDDFLIFSANKTCTVTIHTNCVPYWLEFDNDGPMRLEDTPVSFWKSILKNI